MRTCRLHLLPVSALDAESMHRGLQALNLYRFIPGEPPASVDELRARYKRLESGRSTDGKQLWYNWVILDVASKCHIGFVQATMDIEDTYGCLLAYVLFEEAWGYGYGREAVGAVIQHLLRTLKCSTFKALIDTRNAPSINLVESLGFSKVATHLAADYFKGSQSDEFEYLLYFGEPHYA